jgi:hypothetical protein
VVSRPRYAAAQVADLRDCRLYRFYVTHPTSGAVVLGYVGETVRVPLRRLMEHIESQPWSDTVVRWEVDSQVFAGKTAVLAAEDAAIKAERPLYNVEGNLANPVRVPPWVAQEQRKARDLARGVQSPSWDRPLVASARSGAAARKPSARPAVRATGTPLGGWLVGSMVAWPVLAILGMLVGVRLSLSFGRSCGVGAIAATGAVLLAPVVWWLFKSLRRRTRRKVGVWAAAGVAVGLLWLLWPVIGPHLLAHLPADMTTTK